MTFEATPAMRLAALLHANAMARFFTGRLAKEDGD